MGVQQFDYGKSALLVYNMQEGNPNRNTIVPNLLRNVRRLVDACHEAGRPVVFGQHISLPAGYQPRYYAYWLSTLGEDVGAWSEKWADGAPATQIVPELKPSVEDLVIKKHVASLFVETNAEVVLRSKGVETLILTGVTTEHGIDSTARHASFLGFMPVIVEDAVGSKKPEYKAASLLILKNVFHCDVRSTDYVVDQIRRSAGLSRSPS
ncbi:MAG: cysteine hydrolase [Thaumarchaeota archaeon]|nr:cysteine hydrolase [Nitrososphaerota archaeon]